MVGYPEYFSGQIPWRTGNLINNISKIETDLQTLGKVAAKVKQGLTFDAIKQLLKKQRYRNAAALPGMFQMCRKYATCANGGDLVSETQMFVKSQCANFRTIDCSLFDARYKSANAGTSTPAARLGRPKGESTRGQSETPPGA